MVPFMMLKPELKLEKMIEHTKNKLQIETAALIFSAARPNSRKSKTADTSLE